MSQKEDGNLGSSDPQTEGNVPASGMVECKDESITLSSSCNSIHPVLNKNNQMNKTDDEESEVELIKADNESVETINIEAPEMESNIESEVISNESIEIVVNKVDPIDETNEVSIVSSSVDCNGRSADIIEIQAESETINLDNYRNKIIEVSDDSDTSDSDSSSTVSEENEDASDDGSEGAKDEPIIEQVVKCIKTKGEVGIKDLPPIEDLEISVEENKCQEIGTIYCIVDTQVVVQSFKNSAPLDLDTVLFLDRGQRPLGKIFDVLGNIQEPLYSIRFNSPENIKEKNICKDQLVYCAPQTEYTTFVDTAELMKKKGSDASWRDNNEPPETCLDFSDDEDEVRSKRPSGPLGSKRDCRGDNDSFVKKMNQKNLELTAKRRKEDDWRQKRIPSGRKMVPSGKNSVEMVSFSSPSFSPFSDSYKHKGRSFVGGDQCSGSRIVNYRYASSASLANKFEPVSRSVNFLVGGYSSPSNFTFPPQHYLYSSPRQLPNVLNAQNYLTMYTRPTMSSANAMSSPPPPPPPPFTNYTSPNIGRMQPTFATIQPSMHPNLQSSMAGAIPPQFATFPPLSAPPLPSSLPQQSFYPCSDAASVHQPTFIPMSMRPTISAASFHPQFVLPPPPPPPPPAMHHPHHRDLTVQRSDRRNPQSQHQANSSFYPTSPYNS